MRAIVFSIDRRFVMPLGVALSSLDKVAWEDDDLSIYVIHDGLTEADQSVLQRCCPRIDVRFLNIDLRHFDGVFSTARLGLMTYARLFAPFLIPESNSLLVYCDADMIFCRSPQELFSVDLEGHPLAAVLGSGCPVVSFPGGVRPWKEMGLDPKTPCFNAGLLVIDSHLWKSLSVTDRVMDFCISQGSELNNADQDGLNAIVAGGFKMLPQVWNVTSDIRMNHHYLDPFLISSDVEVAKKSPAILHFTGMGPKPWQRGCPDPARETWLQSYRNSILATRFGPYSVRSNLKFLGNRAWRSAGWRLGLL